MGFSFQGDCHYHLRGFPNNPLKGGVITDWRGGFVGTGRDLSLRQTISKGGQGLFNCPCTIGFDPDAYNARASLYNLAG